MKISVVQLILGVVFSGVTLAFEGRAQDFLNKPITINSEETRLRAVLTAIEKQADVRFVYSSKAIRADRKVTVNTSETRLSDVLNKVLSPLQINYHILEGQIILNPADSSPAPAKKVIRIDEETENADATHATDLTVRGRVTDEKGEALIGVNVVEKGTPKGTNTDVDGKFNIDVTNASAVLVLSFVGYLSQEIAVGNQSEINVVFKENDKALDEVVVVGYGTQSKSNVSGAITTVSSKNIALSPAANLGAGLAGRVSGLTINNRGGEPGNESVEIFIRGRSTTGDASPLYVIDGIVRDYGALSYLPPNDIESITVLKDASAAIYGSRAANGVILVTTKRGKSGKANITATYNHAIIQPERVPDVSDAFTFASMVNLQQRIKGLPEQYSANDLDLYQNGGDPLNHPNTSWPKLVFKPWSQQRRADVSVTGGSEDVKYFVGLGYLDQDSPFRKSFTGDQQYHFRSNIDAQINKNLKISLDLSGRMRKNSASHADYAHIFLGVATLNGIYPNGLVGPGRGGNSPILMTRSRDYGYTDSRAGNFMSTVSADYQIPGVDGLSVQGNFAFDYDNNYQKNWMGVTYFNVLNPTTGEYDKVQNSNAAAPQLNVLYPNGNSITTNLKLNYKKTFARNHSFDAFIGFEQNTTQSYTLSAGRTNFASGSIQELFAGDSNKDNQSNNGSSAATGRENLFGRALYSFMDKYTLQFLFRYDGSQNFPEGKRYGFFPGVSGAWNISRENFMKDVKHLDYLKLRASYGELGNDKIGPYQYLTSYTYGNNYAFNGVTNQGLVQTNAPNPNITWEVAKTMDIGLEFGLFGGIINGELDVFNTKRSNILAQRNASVPTYTGLSLPQENIGETRNKGIELSLSHNNRIGNDFKYTVDGNFTYAKNTVVFVDELPNLPAYQKAEGKPIGAPLIYETVGIFRDQAQVDGTPHLGDNVPGDLIFKDVNNDGKIDNLDQVRQNFSASPQIVYGVNFRFDYKSLQLILGFQGQANGISEVSSIVPFDPQGWGGFPSVYAENVWSPENPDGTRPAPGQTFGRGGSFTTYNWTSSAFLKLKTAEIGYNFSSKMLSKAGLRSARVYVSGTNLFFIHDNFRDTKLSPEQTNWGWGLSQQRAVNLGLSINF